MSLVNIFIVGFLTENIVLTRFLGICSFLGTSNKRKNSFWMGIAVIFVTVLASIFSYLIYNYVLVPYNSTYLRTLMFILIQVDKKCNVQFWTKDDVFLLRILENGSSYSVSIKESLSVENLLFP